LVAQEAQRCRVRTLAFSFADRDPRSGNQHLEPESGQPGGLPSRTQQIQPGRFGRARHRREVDVCGQILDTDSTEQVVAQDVSVVTAHGPPWMTCPVEVDSRRTIVDQQHVAALQEPAGATDPPRRL
jgi:hypothetical protein